MEIPPLYLFFRDYPCQVCDDRGSVLFTLSSKRQCAQRFVILKTFCEQGFEMWGKRSRFGLVWGKARGSVDAVVPVFCPGAIFRAGAGLPMEHLILKGDADPGAEFGEDFAGVQEHLFGVEDGGILTAGL